MTDADLREDAELGQEFLRAVSVHQPNETYAQSPVELYERAVEEIRDLRASRDAVKGKDRSLLMNVAGIKVGCLDCGAVYSEFPLDTTLPDEQWRMIHNSGGGILCASCIVKRAARLPNIIAIRARFEFAGATAAEAHREAQITALRKLQEFALWVLDGYRTGEVGDIDGFCLQEKALELGLLCEGTAEGDPNFYHSDALSLHPTTQEQG